MSKEKDTKSKFDTYHWLVKRLLILSALLALCCMVIVVVQPYLVHRFVSKTYANYKIYLLKYPNSHFVESKTRPTSKVSRATDYTYSTLDDIDTVQKYMEQQTPGFIRLQGYQVVNEPTYRNRTCLDGICIEIKIYPSNTGETLIIMSEHWYSMGFPKWLPRVVKIVIE